MTDLLDVIADLRSEAEQIDRMVVDLDADGWAAPTTVSGWTVGHQIAHLAALFRLVGLAASDPVAFTALISQPRFDVEARVRASLSGYLLEPPGALFPRWYTEREHTAAVLAAVPPGQAVPWLAAPLNATVLAGAAMTELFRHGHDIADALGLRRDLTDRIRHVVEFAVLPSSAGYRPAEWTPPGTDFHLLLTAPSGGRWEFGPAGSPQRINGSAGDFCLLATGRGRRSLDLLATGEAAERWLAEARNHLVEVT
ncbi:maleylpyruvate isomerase family mycothiol-dependent enzyme [Streptosporangium sp. NPDC051023]|uniref:maleylpyruvate isomerase family mycothiol-dependent enzyme n=1 Tax=Streptosporangium sp. NPDC051023 TaxID=3155410 RepID=UPI00344B8D9B